MENRSTYVCLIRATRPGFVEQMLPEEEKAMGEHAGYLDQLLREKVLFLAGPCLDRAFGMMIFEAESLEAARQIVARDPSVKSGHMSAEIHPFHVSFLRPQA